MQHYFGVSAPAVHRMVVALEERGLIQRVPRTARSIRVTLPSELLPNLNRNPSAPAQPAAFARDHPSIAAWVSWYGRVELGYDPNTDTSARVLGEGGLIWSGGRPTETVDDWLQAMEAGLAEFMDRQGLG